MKPWRAWPTRAPVRVLLAVVVAATTAVIPAAPQLQCTHLAIASSNNHSSAEGSTRSAHLSVTALDVAPSTGTLFAAASDLDNPAAIGEVLVYRRGELQVRPLALHRDVGALTDGFAPTELTLMEVGNAVLLAIVANTAPRGGDSLEILRVEDALGRAGPTGLSLLQTVILPGVGARITGLWAVWPRGVYVTSCSGLASVGGCMMHHCQGAEPDWRAAEAAAGAWRRLEYSCAIVSPSTGAEKDGEAFGTEDTSVHGVVGSPMLKAIYTVRTQNSRRDSASDAPAGSGERLITVPELVGLSRDSRASPATPEVSTVMPWHVASIADDEEDAISADAESQPGKARLSLHHKLWVEIATGELLTLQSSPSHCVIFSVPAPEEAPGHKVASVELREIARSAERCTAVVRLPPGESDVLVPPLAIGISRTWPQSGTLAICEESRTDPSKKAATEATQRGREEL